MPERLPCLSVLAMCVCLYACLPAFSSNCISFMSVFLHVYMSVLANVLGFLAACSYMYTQCCYAYVRFFVPYLQDKN